MPKNKGLGKPTYDHILNLIMSGQLKPGEKIPETKIAEKFKTSRTPVRDAMRQLANDGLLEIYPRRFAQVKEYTPEMITEIGALRISLDTLSVTSSPTYRGGSFPCLGRFGSRSIAPVC